MDPTFLAKSLFSGSGISPLAVCTECRSIYSFDAETTGPAWTVVHSDEYDAEGIALTGDMWTKAAEEGISDLAELDKYQTVSDQQYNRRMRLMIPWFGVTAVAFAIIFAFVGPVPAFGIIILSSIVMTLVSNRIDEKAEAEINKKDS